MVLVNKEEKKEIIRIFNENFFDVLDEEKLIEYLENQGATYLASREDVIDQWTDLMEVKCPVIYLDEDKIIEDDTDWEELSKDKFLNTFRLFEEDFATKELRLKEIIKYDTE